MKRWVLAVWDFVVGDDWVTAAGVVLAGGATAALQSAGVVAGWIVPVAGVGLLTRAGGRRRGGPGGPEAHRRQHRTGAGTECRCAAAVRRLTAVWCLFAATRANR